jgi:hypothetical protein
VMRWRWAKSCLTSLEQRTWADESAWQNALAHMDPTIESLKPTNGSPVTRMLSLLRWLATYQAPEDTVSTLKQCSGRQEQNRTLAFPLLRHHLIKPS